MTAPATIPAPAWSADGRYLIGTGVNLNEFPNGEPCTACAVADEIFLILESNTGVNDANGDPIWYTWAIYGAMPFAAYFAGRQAAALHALLAEKGMS